MGVIQGCNVLTTKQRGASLSFDQWRLGIPARNREITQQPKKADGAELALQCLDKTLKEAAKGWVLTPQLATEDIIRTVPISTRFAIREQHGNATMKKIRHVVDFKRSDVNSLLKLRDARGPNPLDAMFAMGRASALSRA